MALLLNASDSVNRSYTITKPSPTHPLDVNGTGERTGNLAQWEKGGISITTGADEAYRTAEQGGTCEQLRSLYIPCYGNADYVLHTNHYPVQTFISYYDADKNYISRSSGSPQSENRVFTTPETARYMRAQLAHVVTGQVYPAIEENQQYAITFGSTPLPYEPYGIKIPISCGGTTNNVYLGEVETTRRIKKLVLTGEEANWYYYENATSTVKFFYLVIIRTVGVHLNNLLNTHGFNMAEVTQQSGNILIRAYAVSEGIGTVEEWKAYLAAQYANGTPVTVWYVLAEPETAVVNEPLMKIGDYADTISNISIPVTTGGDTLSVGTTVQPSEVTVNYKGWHPVADVHECDNGAWT